MVKWYDEVEFIPPPMDYWEPLPMSMSMSMSMTPYYPPGFMDGVTQSFLADLMIPAVDPRILILPEKTAMTENEWLTSTDPAAMLAHIGACNDSRLEVFITAYRERWLHAALAYMTDDGGDGFRGHRDASLSERCDLIRELFGNPFRPVTLPTFGESMLSASPDGNAPRLYESKECPWLSWNDGLIPKLAKSIRGEKCKHCGGDGKGGHREHWNCEYCWSPSLKISTGKTPSRFEDMPILADAMEEAGMNNDQIQEHLRGPNIHVRDCWVLSLLVNEP